MKRIILHIDMNSYFATAEQQANPFLRGKPIAIGGSEGTRSVIVAASLEAKAFGIKTAMNYYEAIKLCPHLYFVNGDPVKYAAMTQIFFDICKEYSDRMEIYSIDELFLDLTGWVESIEEACHVVEELKHRLRKEVGEYISCSVGIAPNRMMAKLASSMKKPDGLTVYREEDFPEVLKWIEMTDIPGIGYRIKGRLIDMGIRTLEQLGRHPIAALQQEFGPNYGKVISNMGKGIDTTEIPYIDEIEQTKSMGHTYTLAKNTFNRDDVYGVLCRLSEKVGRRLRKDQYQGRLVWVWLRWADMGGKREHRTLKYRIDDGYEIYQIGKSIIHRWAFHQAVRAVGIGVSLLAQDAKQLSVLEAERKRQQLLEAQDIINDRYGEKTIQRGRAMGVKLKRKVGGFKEQGQFSYD